LGVIIRRGRIVAAGCQFPLSESAAADRALGSRHRAALGISEEADAVVVVVSEETGAISVAEQGRLRRNVSSDGLREIMVEALIHPRSEQESKRKAGETSDQSAEQVTTDGTSQAA